MIDTFTLNEAANELHSQALIRSKDHRFVEARAAYTQALKVLGPSDGDPSISLQRARIRRDLSFVSARQALVEKEGADLVTSIRGLKNGSISDTEALVMEDASTYSSEAREHLYAEHGASLGILARICTVACVVLPRAIKALDPEAISAYQDAREFLSEGDDAYYAVSNEANAARHEALLNRFDHAQHYMGIARHLAVSAVMRRDPNGRAAFRTFVVRRASIRNEAAAERSIRKRP